MNYLVSTINQTLEQLPSSHIYRYMGVSEISPDGGLFELVESVRQRFFQKLQCQACYGVVPVKILDDFVDLSVFSVSSTHLARNLQGCERAIIFAATLGMENEQQRRRAAAVSPTEALVLDAMGSAGIEQFCNQICSEFGKLFPAYRMRPRFSPGYGDFSLKTQKQLLHVLDAQRKIGISMSDGYLMIPQKSVTAIVGLSKYGCEKTFPGCEHCVNAACEFRL